MTGYNTVLKIRRLEEELNKIGLRMASSKFGRYDQFDDGIAVYPKDADAMPIYSRDHEVFCGSLEALELWFSGFIKAREYDMMVFGIKHNDAREKKEQQIRNKQLLKTLKEAGQEKEEHAS